MTTVPATCKSRRPLGRRHAPSQTAAICRHTVLGALLLFGSACSEPASDAPSTAGAEIPDVPTFSEHIAPIIFANCTGCHRPGEAGPFDFLTYEDVRKRARQIAEVTADRYMPPWLPVEGHGRFVGERRLARTEIDLIQRWADSGAQEGDRSKLPPLPAFPEGWQLGEPDVVVTLPEPFALPADGTDIYRNFVIPTDLSDARFVRALVFDPGATKAIHHAFVLTDQTGQARDRDANSVEPGFPGMDPGPGASAPDGHFISWQPGKTPLPNPEGTAWRLPARSDLVVQLHMRPTGRPESIAPRIGLYFTNEPPSRQPFKIVLATHDIDIPPGDAEYTVETHYRVPVDVQVAGVVPHAHYLGKRLHGFATLPDGSTRWIIRIDRWDFNWQGAYHHDPPVPVPAGSIITQRFTFDNSADNPANPFAPPRRVTYGLNSDDEMAELWLQLIPRNPDDLDALRRDYTRWAMNRRQAELTRRIADAPTADDLVELAKIELGLGMAADARRHLVDALALDTTHAEGHFVSGMLSVRENDFPAAHHAFTQAVTHHPQHLAARNALGNLALQSGNLDSAAEHYRRALEINPDHPTALSNLGAVELRRGNTPQAIDLLAKALEADPANARARQNLEQARQQVTQSQRPD